MYVSSDNSLMNLEDLVCWLQYILDNDLYNKWSFDELTGGYENFLKEKDYIELKKWFQKYK